MSVPIGVTLDTLEVALKVAGVQAEEMHNRYPESDVLDQVRLQINHLYELVHDEVRIWARAERLER